MAGSGSYRFTRRPKWIAGHLLALIAVVGFINLGLWQLSRHDERSAVNKTIEERMTSEPVGLDSLLAQYGEDPAVLEYRRTIVRGVFLTTEEVLWQARTLSGRSGHDVLTPLTFGDRALVVDRGWVPIDSEAPVTGAEPPGGEVVVSGVIRPGRVRQGVGPIDPATGVLTRISRVDIDRLQRQIDLELYPFYLLLQEQTPEQTAPLPLPQIPPETDSGPHLSYAIQWFIFSAIAAIGYPVLLVRTARDELDMDVAAA